MATGQEIDQRFARGMEFLMQRPPDLPQGLNNLMIAANAGHAQAERLLAVYTAAGFGLPQSWTAALDRLQRAAELGSPEAQKELRFLAHEASEVVGDWRALRTRIDLTAWLAAPKMRPVHASPRIAIVENFVSHEICDWLIACATPRLERAVVYDSEQGARVDPARSNSAHHFPIWEKDLVFLFVQSRIATITERLVSDMEMPAILHYAVGEEFLPHVDFIDTEAPAYAQQVAMMGQRVVTFLLYLNDDYEGARRSFRFSTGVTKDAKATRCFSGACTLTAHRISAQFMLGSPPRVAKSGYSHNGFARGRGPVGDSDLQKRYMRPT